MSAIAGAQELHKPDLTASNPICYKQKLANLVNEIWHRVKWSLSLIGFPINYKLKGYKWYNDIHTEGNTKVTLGAIPFFKPDGEHTVRISMIEDWEERFIRKSVKDQFNELVRCPTRDFAPVDVVTISKGVEAIKKALNENKSVYIHCKAGVGRSGAVVVAWMMSHMAAQPDVDPYDTDTLYKAAKQAVQEKRPQLNVCSETQIKQWFDETYANARSAP
jgi:atypical dual specificity phosphatase